MSWKEKKVGVLKHDGETHFRILKLLHPNELRLAEGL